MGVQDVTDIHVLLAFMQFLFDNSISKTTIANYISAIKKSFVMYGLKQEVFTNKKIALLLKSFSINKPFQVKIKGIIDFDMLHSIIKACHALQFPLTFQPPGHYRNYH